MPSGTSAKQRHIVDCALCVCLGTWKQSRSEPCPGSTDTMTTGVVSSQPQPEYPTNVASPPRGQTTACNERAGTSDLQFCTRVWATGHLRKNLVQRMSVHSRCQKGRWCQRDNRPHTDTSLTDWQCGLEPFRVREFHIQN